MTKETLELATILQEAINLLVELESHLAEPDRRERDRLTREVMPRLADLKKAMDR